MPNPKCTSCGKTVYSVEDVRIGDMHFHKWCVRCQGMEGDAVCGLALTLKTANGIGGKIYCNKHKPVDKPTALTVEGSMALSNAKRNNEMTRDVKMVNNEKLGTGDVGHQGVLDMHHSNAVTAHENARNLVNDQRVDKAERGTQSADTMALTNAKNAPKIDTVNQQISKGSGKNLQTADGMATTNALNAPKVGVVNEQIRARGNSVNAQVADMATTNAMKAPKAGGPVNEQIRSTDKPSQVADITTQSALNAPKAGGPVNEQIRSTDKPSQVADMTMETALNAPNSTTLVNEQVRAGGSHQYRG